MNSLLRRQIRKYLPEDLKQNEDLKHFLDAIDKSYTNYDNQFSMQQRAMGISSEELFEANQKLRKETKSQEDVIAKLKHVIETLKFYNLPEDADVEAIDIMDVDGAKLVDFIDNQTKEIVAMNKQREKLLGELAYQNQELSDYAHMVSHDLKSPLRSIETLTTWLSLDYSDKLDAQGKKNLVMIQSNVRKMDNLINGILEYSTIAKNRFDVYDVNLENLLHDVIEDLHVPEHIKVFKVELPVVRGDKYRLEQLFKQLLSNAINSIIDPKGEIKISYSDKDEFWEFAIEDNGKGIEQQYFRKIFKTFQKLENDVEKSGIGLSIAKRIVDIYGGKIWLTSDLGKGTTFYFTIKKQPDGRT